MSWRFWRRRRDLDDELSSHLAMAERDHVDRGESEERARRLARREFGNVLLVKETVRDMQGLLWFDRCSQDVRIGLKRLRARPLLNLTAVLVLALAIGTSTAMFTLLDAFLFRPLPFQNADRIAAIWMRSKTGGRTTVLPAVLAAWQTSGLFEAVEGAATETVVLDGADAPLVRQSAFVSVGMFEMLGIRPIRGRLFDASEGRAGTDDRALISEDLWRGTFGADASIVGRRISLNGHSIVVVGVLPRHFRFPEWNTVVWRPLDFGAQPPGPTKLPRAFVKFRERASSPDVLRLAGDLAHNVDPLTAQRWPERDDLRHDYFGTAYVRSAVPLLGGGVALTFLLLCANVGGLLLARLTERRREFGMCTALGASRGHILEQAFVESALLCAVGALAGVLVAVGLVSAAASLLPTAFLSHSLNPLDIDARALMVATTLGVVATMAAGWIPAWLGTEGMVPRHTLDRATSESGRSRIFARALLVGQVGIACAVLVAATLLIRSFTALSQIDIGYEPSGKVALSVSAESVGRDPAAARAVVDRAATVLEGLPGVRHVLRSQGLPLFTSNGLHFWDLQGDVGSAAVPVEFETYGVPPGWFASVGMRMLDGRDFMRNEDSDSIIVSSRFASRLWPSRDPVGRTVQWGENQQYRVIGVVNDTVAPLRDLEVHFSEVYLPLGPAAIPSTLTLVCGPCPSMGTVRQRLLTDASEVTVWRLDALEQLQREELAPSRAMATLGVVFGILAMTVASGGLFSVLHQTVSRRRREFGIRVGLGSTPGAVRRLALRDGMTTALVGAALGSFLGWVATPLLSSLLYGVTRTDLLTWAFVLATMVITAIAASWQPARQAMRVDPAVLLRED